jgi:hypothetical protein
VSAKTEILDSMADAIRTILDTSTDWDFQVEPRLVLSPTPPAIDIYPGDPASDQETESMGATHADINAGYMVNVRARIAPNDHEAGQEVLLVLSDPEDDLCLVQALYDDPTLGGRVADISLVAESGFTVFTDIDPTKVYLGILWRFLVVPARS